jgi:hypothetical protein
MVSVGDGERVKVDDGVGLRVGDGVEVDVRIIVAVAVGKVGVMDGRGVGAGSPGERSVAQDKSGMSSNNGIPQRTIQLAVKFLADDMGILAVFFGWDRRMRQINLRCGDEHE